MYPAPGTGYGAGFGGGVPAGGSGGGGTNREVRYKVTVTGDVSHAQQQFQNLTASAHQAANAARMATPYGVLPATDRPAYQPGFSAAQYSSASGSMYGRSPFGPPSAPPAAGPAAPPSAGGGAMAAFSATLSGLTTALTTAAAAVTALGQASNAAQLSMRSTLSARAKWESGLGAVPLVGGVLQSVASPVFDMREVYGLQEGSYLQRGLQSGLAKGTYERAKADKGWWGRQWEGTWFDWSKQGSAMAAAAGEAAADQDYVFNSPFVQAGNAVRQRQAYALEDLEYGDALMELNATTRTTLAREQAGLLFRPEKDFVGPDLRRVSFDKDAGYDAIIRQAVREQAGAKAGVGMARNEYDLAKGQRLNSDSQQQRGRDSYEKAQREVNELAERAKTDTDVNGKLAKAQAVAAEQQAKYLAEVQRYQEAITREKQAGLRLTEREYELSQRKLDVTRAELQVLEQKREKLKGYAEQFGAMDPVRQQAVANVAGRAEARGFRSLTPEEKELLLSTGATQEFARERSRKAAFDSPQFRQVLRQVGLQDKQMLDAEIGKLKGKVELELVVNAEQLEKQLRAALQLMGPLQTDAILRVVRAQLQGVELRRIASMVTGGVGGV
jgi:hypothetical protein